MPDLLESDNHRLCQSAPCKQLVLPDATLWWWPGWLAADKAMQIYLKLEQDLPWQQPQIRLFGKAVSIPRRQVWMGESHCSYRYSGVRFLPEPWHPIVLQLTQAVNRQLNRNFNAVLINWYQDGQEHMGWHQDNEEELGPQPDIASLSLGQPRRFDLKHLQLGLQMQIALGHGDLLLMEAPCQQFWQHRLSKDSKALTGRMNFTFRTIDKQL